MAESIVLTDVLKQYRQALADWDRADSQKILAVLTARDAVQASLNEFPAIAAADLITLDELAKD